VHFNGVEDGQPRGGNLATPGVTNGTSTPAQRRAAIAIAFLLAAASSAQISPGPLSRPHQKLEGSRACLQCHRSGKGVDSQRCLKCHAALAQRIAAGKGLHSRPTHTQCEHCHAEHNGVDYALVYWGKQGKNAFDLVIVVNPELTEREGRQVEEEGCLSVPGFNASVPRPMRAVVRGRDRDGRQCTIEGRGLLARAIQHELDHLEGRLYLDRLRGLHRALLVHRINRRVRKGAW